MAEDAVWAAERATEEPGKEILREGGKTPLPRFEGKDKIRVPQRALPGERPKMKDILIHKLCCGFESYALDHYLRNFILKLRYQLPRHGLSKKKVVQWLLAFEGTLKFVRFLH